MKWGSLIAGLTVSAVLQPLVAWDLLRVAWRFRHRKWYKRFPFLPVPSMAYLRWRMYTAYGDEDYLPPKTDVIAFARWLRHQP